MAIALRLWLRAVSALALPISKASFAEQSEIAIVGEIIG
jgi:hypothetical protein